MRTVLVSALLLATFGGCESERPPLLPSPSQVGGELPLREQYPAFTPDIPQVQNAGGPVQDSPQVVAITFPDEPLVADIEAFAATVGTLPYWTATTAEYGVGTMVGLPPIRLTEPAPTTTSDHEIQLWLQAKVADPSSGFPAPSVNVTYAIYYPATTLISDMDVGTSCMDYYGYHNSTIAPDGTPIIYAVLPRCDFGYLTPLQLLTSATSHELIEAATDPRPIDDPAFQTVDDNHSLWSYLVGGGEVGDLCAQNVATDFAPEGFPYYVQRIWSNEAAAAGRDPCVPGLRPVYFGATPTVAPGIIDLDFGGGFTMSTEGYRLPVGSSVTIDLGLYSTGDTDGPWNLTAVDLDSAGDSSTPPTLGLTLDRHAGTNGDHAQLTVTTLAVSQGPGAVTGFAIVSSFGDPKAGPHDPGFGRSDQAWFGLVATTAP